MPAMPPRLTFWSEQLAASQPDIFAVKPSVTGSWRYLMGALGYWMPNSLNTSKGYRRQIRSLR